MATKNYHYDHPPQVRQGDGVTQDFIVNPLRLFKDLLRGGRMMTAYRDSFWVEDADNGWYEGPLVYTIWRKNAEGA
jgi:hypothetical protein